MRRRGALVPDTIGRVLAGAVVILFLVGACSAGASPTPVPGPDRVKAAGELTVCTDLANPPSASSARTTPA